MTKLLCQRCIDEVASINLMNQMKIDFKLVPELMCESFFHKKIIELKTSIIRMSTAIDGDLYRSDILRLLE